MSNLVYRYATDTGLSQEDQSSLADMAKGLNSHIFGYTGQSGQSATDRMYKGNGGVDLDNQPQLAKLRRQYAATTPGALGRAAQQIGLFTGKQSYGSDIRTNREKFPEFHALMDSATPIPGGLTRGTILTDVRHGTPGQPIDISKHFKVGDKVTSEVTSATSDPNLAKAWVLDDKQRFDKAKETGDNSELDTKYNGARHGAFVVHHYPPGIKGLQVAPLSEVPEHNEVVPQAGQNMVISKVTGPDQDGVHHVYYDHDTTDKPHGGAISGLMGQKESKKMNWNERYASEKTGADWSLIPPAMSNWSKRYAAEDTFGYGDPHYFEKLIDHANSGNPKLIQQKHVDFARAHGITEDEMMHAYTQGHSIASYVSARRRNDPWLGGPEAMEPRLVATHDEAIDALNKGVVPNHYSLLRTVGETILNGRHNPTPTPLDHDEAVAKAGKITPQEKQRFMF